MVFKPTVRTEPMNSNHQTNTDLHDYHSTEYSSVSEQWEYHEREHGEEGIECASCRFLVLEEYAYHVHYIPDDEEQMICYDCYEDEDTWGQYALIEGPLIDIPLCGTDENDEEPMGEYDYTGLEGMIE